MSVLAQISKSHLPVFFAMGKFIYTLAICFIKETFRALKITQKNISFYSYLAFHFKEGETDVKINYFNGNKKIYIPSVGEMIER